MKIIRDGKFLVDENGEVIDELAEGKMYAVLEEGERVLRKRDIEPIEKAVEIRMRFAKVNFLVIGEICDKYSIFPKLIPYVGYMSGKLIHRNGRVITREKLPAICGVSKVTVDRQLKGLLKDDILKRELTDEGVVFYMNPYVVHLGRKINESLFKMFENTEYRYNYEKVLGGPSEYRRKRY